MAVRLVRTPDSVLLQAAGEFRALARTTYLSSAVSVLLTFALLLGFGPIVSLFGILAGDTVMAAQIRLAARRWRRGHG
jgi:putative peptidoglycan lipid II flippase